LKVGETAVLLGVSTATIYRLHKRHELPSFKMAGLGVRVDCDQLGEMIEAAKARNAS
jgi:excisionase family DNA binding protein